MKRIQLFIGLTLIVNLAFTHLSSAQSIFDYNGITYKVLKEADEASTFGTVAVTAKDDGFYEGTITIPNAVKQSDDEFADTYKVVAIDDFAFKGNTTLTKVVLPMTIESIGNGAFEECAELTQIEILQGNLTQIGQGAFASSGLTSIKLPEGITELPAFTFKECRDLKEIILPESLQIIGINTFGLCQSLKAIELPKNLLSIDVMAFMGCGLTSIHIPDNVTSIAQAAFCHCFDLEEVVLSPYTTSINAQAFAFCGKLSKINKPETIKKIEDGAFLSCINVPEYYDDYINLKEEKEAEEKLLEQLGDEDKEKYKKTRKETVQQNLEQIKKFFWK